MEISDVKAKGRLVLTEEDGPELLCVAAGLGAGHASSERSAPFEDVIVGG